MNDKEQEQRRQVWSAAQTLLGWAGMIALLAGGYHLAGRLPESVQDGPGVIVFMDRKIVQNALFWAALFLPVIVLMLIAFMTTVVRSILSVVVLVGLIGAVGWAVYGRVAAMAFVGNEVELRYVWPRSAERMPAGEIVSMRYEDGLRTAMVAVPEYTLYLSTRQGEYQPYADTSFEEVQGAMGRIRGMQVGRR
jgi:hypothetical protein